MDVVRFIRAWITPLIALFIAFAIGAILMITQGSDPVKAYQSLFTTAFSTQEGLAKTFGKATPLAISGLAVVIGLRAGLFNIGAQGQLISGALAAAWAGYAITGLPMIAHVPLCLLIGGFFGSIVGYIAGALKAYRGIHEVITTIMLNSIVLQLAEYLSNGPLKEEGSIIARTPEVLATAKIGSVAGLPIGFFLSGLLALSVWWIFKKTTTGFRFETVGKNKNAAWYAGIAVKRNTVFAMVACGALAGFGGAVETLGVVGKFEPAFNQGLGFDGITIALLARANPLAVIPGAILFGGMRGAGPTMQFSAGVSPEIIDLILAIVLFFVTAPIISRILKLKNDTTTQVTSGWGSN